MNSLRSLCLLTVLLAAAPALAVQMQAGKWKLVTHGEMPGGLPIDDTRTVCMSAEQLDSTMKGHPPGMPKDCQQTMDQQGNIITVDIKCPMMSVHGTVTEADAAHFTSTSVTSLGKGMTVNSAIAGTYLGACD